MNWLRRFNKMGIGIPTIFVTAKGEPRLLQLKQGMDLAEAVVDTGGVRFPPMMLTAAAVIVGFSVAKGLCLLRKPGAS